MLNKMTSVVKRGNPDDLLQTIQTMLAGRSYMVAGADKEKDFQNTLYLIFIMLGYKRFKKLLDTLGQVFYNDIKFAMYG